MRRLVLLGGGHAQINVLANLAERPLAGCDIRLVTPYQRQIYSGMLPGWIAGYYTIDARDQAGRIGRACWRHFP